MSFFNKVSDKIAQVKQHHTHKKDFEKKIIDICSDGKITDDELQQINQILEEYQLEEEDIKGALKIAYKTAFKAILSDGIITEEEENDIKEIQQVLLVPDKQIAKDRKILEKHELYREIRKGNLPILSLNSIVLKNGEVVHYAIPCKLQEERVVRSGYTGGSAGVNIRVAKGVSFRVGQHKGRFQSQKAVQTVDEGLFILTNKRFLYKGKKKSFSLTFNQILSYDIFSDGVEVSPNRGKTKSVLIKDRLYDPDVLQLIAEQVI